METQIKVETKEEKPKSTGKKSTAITVEQIQVDPITEVVLCLYCLVC